MQKQSNQKDYGNTKMPLNGEGGAVGAAVRGATPSFLVPYSGNVNAAASKAGELLTVWDFLEHKGRVGRTQVLFNRKDNPRTILIVGAKRRSRYFPEGRLYSAWKIERRLGRFSRVPGLMESVTYDPKKISQREAWAQFGGDIRRFLNAVNQYRRGRGWRSWRRLHYLWVVEAQPGTGYPHVHIFFPNLKWLAPLGIINSNWGKGRANIESPKKIIVNCAGYICKYLKKMEGWEDLQLALLWSGGCRMYGFSRGFSADVVKKESEWRRWHIIQTENPEEVVRSLEEGGYNVEGKGVGDGK